MSWLDLSVSLCYCDSVFVYLCFCECVVALVIVFLCAFVIVSLCGFMGACGCVCVRVGEWVGV